MRNACYGLLFSAFFLLLSNSSSGEPLHSISQEPRVTKTKAPHTSAIVRPQQEGSEVEITLEKILYGLGRQDRDSEPQNTFEKLTERERKLAEKVDRWQKNIALVLESTKDNKAVEDMRAELGKVWNEQLSLGRQIEERIATVMNEHGYAAMSTGSHTYESKSGKSAFNVLYNVNTGKIEVQNMRD
jgi:hypothetical protein